MGLLILIVLLLVYLLLTDHRESYTVITDYWKSLPNHMVNKKNSLRTDMQM